MNEELTNLTIGKLAKILDLNIETIRYYHRENLLKMPAKRNNGYRYYGKDHYSQLLFIKKAKELGFTLNEIKEMLQLNSNKKNSCMDVISKVDLKISEIDKKIENLKIIKSALRNLRQTCSLGDDELKSYNMLDCFFNKCNC